jgi:coronin-7
VLQKEYFQDDVFPDTKVLWEPTLTADEWFAGIDKEPKRISLKPEGMENCKYGNVLIDNSIKCTKKHSTSFLAQFF